MALLQRVIGAATFVMLTAVCDYEMLFARSLPSLIRFWQGQL